MRISSLICILVTLVTASQGIAAAESEIKVVGSSTVYPFAKKVAEQFAEMTGLAMPLEESTGTGEGFRRFLCGYRW